MLRLAWFVLRAAFWLGLLSLFVPGALPFHAITATPVDIAVDRTAQDTLTRDDRVVVWRAPQTKNTNLRHARRAREPVRSAQ